MLVDKFLEIASSQAQIVSLGAGFDTLFWRLQDENRPLKAFVEVDFPLVTMRKVHYIRLRRTLLEKIATNEGEYAFSQLNVLFKRDEVFNVI